MKGGLNNVLELVSLCCDLGWSDSDNFLFD